eukprot:10272147-Prorocentrum_lima.AAC.1
MEQDRFCRGVVTLWDVPYKHMKSILATASNRPLCDIVNLPGCRRTTPRLFCLSLIHISEPTRLDVI